MTGPKAFFKYKNCPMNAVQKFKNYFVEAFAEVKKVTWPTKKQTKNYSLVVIGITLGLAAFFGILDYIFNFLLGLIV